MNRIQVSGLIVAGLFVAGVLGAPYVEQVPGFNRTKSNITVRKVAKATAAALDFAAYSNNPIRFDPEPYKPKPPAKKAGIAEMTFKGYLASAFLTIGETPLTAEEKEAPLAWRPMENKLWEVTKDKGWPQISGKIEGEKWADPQIMRPYQEIAAVYLHGQGDQTEIWVKIDFQPWVKFLSGIKDNDRDGFPEMYGKVSLDSISPANRKAAFEWIRGTYMKKELSREEIADWANVLASYWYPTLNTDIDRNEGTDFPKKETEKEVVSSLRKLTVKEPVAIIRGDPFGKPIYNVFVADLAAAAPPAQAAEPAVAAPVATVAVLDTAISQNFRDNEARLDAEVKANGAYADWAKKSAPYLGAVRKFLTALPAQQMGFKGKEEWVFFRKDLEYMTAGDLAVQAKEKNAIPNLVDFKKYLGDKNVSLLFVMVPNKSEVYFDKLPVAGAPKDATAMVNPYSRKFLKDAQTAGIEVIDLLPAFLAAKKDDATAKEPVYQKQDTHWTDRGLQIAADLIARRIKQYAWFADAAKTPVAFTVTDTTFQRQGDIVERLPEADRASYPPLELKGRQVRNPDGSLIKPVNPGAPVMLIGDSFTGVYELIDCKSAGVGSHVAAQTGVPVEIITSWGGGPEVREMLVKLAGRRANGLKGKRVVVYMMVARDLYNYARGWTPLDMK